RPDLAPTGLTPGRRDSPEALAGDGEATAGRQIAVGHRAVGAGVAVDRLGERADRAPRPRAAGLEHALHVLLGLRVRRDATMGVHPPLARDLNRHLRIEASRE